MRSESCRCPSGGARMYLMPGGSDEERRVVRADDRAGDDGIAAQRGRHHSACDHGVAAHRGSHRALDHRALDRHLRNHACHD